MKLFGIELGKKRVETPKIEVPKEVRGSRFKPFTVNLNVVDDNFKEERWVRTIGPIISWGVDNFLPERITQLYKSSSIHASIINYKRDYLSTNYKFNVGDIKNEIKLQLFKEVIVSGDHFDDFDDFIRKVAEEILLFGNLFIKLCRDDKGKVISVEVIPSTRMRICGDNINMKKSGQFAYSPDWINRLSYKLIPAWNINKKEPESILLWQNKLPDYKFYGTPDWWSAYDAIEVLANIPYFHRQNVLNGISLTGILTLYDYPKSEEDQEDFRRDIERTLLGGLKSTGGLMITDGSTPELKPNFTKIDASSLDKQFIGLFDDMEKIVCYAHNIAPAVMGTPTPGKLGASQEIEFLTAKFEESMNNNKKIITDIVNKLLKICDVDVSFYYDKVDIKNNFEK